MFRSNLIKTFLFVSACSVCGTVMAQPASLNFERKYESGGKLQYELITEYYQNHQWKNRTIALCELSVATDSAGIPYETVRWLAQQSIHGSDTVNETAAAIRVQPYRISLHPKGSLPLPVITEAGMTGAITDFNTFYVAIHYKAGVHTLKRPGDVYRSPVPVKGDFGNGKTIIRGEDCISMSSRLIATTRDEVVVQTSFLPPSQPCLDYYLPLLQQPVSGDTINNIQMIMAAGTGKRNIQFGKERFDITSRISIADGVLIEATMTNELVLKLQVNCNESLGDCQTSLPWHIYRTVRLRLIR